jgi:hypothetical protein
LQAYAIFTARSLGRVFPRIDRKTGQNPELLLLLLLLLQTFATAVNAVIAKQHKLV